MRIRTIVTAVVSLGLFALALAAAWYLLRGRTPTTCQLSDRPIHPHMLTTVRLKGKTIYACCARCGLTYEQQTGERVEILRVTDYLSGTEVDASKAYFVDGSHVEPCCVPTVNREEGRTPYVRMFDRCSPSLIAFATESEARAFAAQHGGTVTRLSELVRALRATSERTRGTAHD